MTHNGIIHNGGGKRNGSFAIYIEPWYADIFDLELRMNHGDEEMRARGFSFGPDLFMEKCKKMKIGIYFVLTKSWLSDA